MVAIRMDVRRGLRELECGFDAFTRRQLPFATAQMLNAVAPMAAAAEMVGIQDTLGPVTAFTRRAMAVRRASKSRPVATIFVKDIQAEYLEPYMPGGSGRQVLKSRAVLAPVDLKTNQYGNIPRGKLDALKGQKDIFIGPVKTKDGVINGVWRRIAAGRAQGRRRRAKGTGVDLGAKGRLELLIRFEDPKAVRPRLKYGQPTAIVLSRHVYPELEKALRQALATAR
jgi:hypothetical protein